MLDIATFIVYIVSKQVVDIYLDTRNLQKVLYAIVLYLLMF